MLVVIYLRVRKEKEKNHDEPFLTLRGCQLRPERETMQRIIRVGLPQAMEMGGMWAIQAVMVRSISGLPQAGTLGAHMIAIRVESMSFLAGLCDWFGRELLWWGNIWERGIRRWR